MDRNRSSLPTHRPSRPTLPVNLARANLVTGTLIAAGAGGGLLVIVSWDHLSEFERMLLILAFAGLILAVASTVFLWVWMASSSTPASPHDPSMPAALPAPRRSIAAPPRDALQLMAMLNDGDVPAVVTAIESDRNIDLSAPDPRNGMTLLHYAAAYDAGTVVRALIRRSGIEVAVMDDQGRTASSLAFEVAGNPRLGRFLVRKEAEQSRRGADRPDQG